MRSKHCLSPPRLALVVTAGLWLGWAAQGWPQSITATLPVAGGSVAVNRATNKIYTAGGSVIDGKTHSIATVPVGRDPVAVAVDETTNKIYVVIAGGLLWGKGSITVIDGATNATTTVVDPNARWPCSIAVNPSTHKVYVGNRGSFNVTVIDGATNATATVAVPNATCAVAVNPTTNRVYAAHGEGVTVIDGASNSATTVSVSHAVHPIAIAVNAVTNRVYVANTGDSSNPGVNHGNVTVIDGNTDAVTTVTDPNAFGPYSIALDSVTNKVYVTNAWSGNITVIDGQTNSTATVTDPNASLLTALNALHPVAAAVNETTHTVYVANGSCDDVYQCAPGSGQGSVTVIDGRTNSAKTIINPSGTNLGAVAVNPLSDEIYVTGSNLTVIDGGGTPTTHTIAVVLPGSGGTVTSSPVGIDCGGGGACAYSYALGTAAKLTASPDSGILFAGWSGPCAGTKSCDLVTNKDQFVAATFNTKVTVPDVVGQTQAGAASAITGAGLRVGKVTQQSSRTAPLGDVMSESPTAGANVWKGSAVDMVISTGIAVPNVVGQTQAAATSAITGAGLVLGTVTQQSSSSVASGSVISESPTAGTGVASGSTVNLVVSSGDPSPSSGAGGGGGIDLLTLGSLFGCVLLAVRRALVLP
jgi:DNA-binding beta-propeller fold protein YncE